MTHPDLASSASGWRRRPSRDSGLALAAGLLVTAGLPPYPWTGALVVVGLGVLLTVMLRTPHPARAAWFFALAHQSTLLYWLFLLDPSKTIPTRALVPVQATLAILYVSLFYLAWGAVVGAVRRRLGPWRALAAAPALWTGMEALRAQGELGFPWCLTGSLAVGTPLQGFARAGGELALGCGVMFLASLLVCARENRRPGGGRARVLVMAAGAVLFWTYLAVGSSWRAAPGGDGDGGAPLLPRPLQVAAVQADVALADKWNEAKLDSTRLPYAQWTRGAAADGAEFVVWAETALPAYLRYDVALMNWTRDLVRGTHIYLFAGFPDADRGPDGVMRKYNSSGLMAPTGTVVDRYAKHHLLPIGESMPFQSLLPVLGKLDVGQAEWTAGAVPRPMDVELPDGRFPFSAQICFESIFGGLARQAVRAGSGCLVVITNDGWFGETAGPRQHAWLARLRAVECGVPVVRCANNGISFICDADGRVIDSLDLGRRGMVRGAIEVGEGRTLYVRAGVWPVAGFLVLWTAVVLLVPWLRAARGSAGAP